VREHSTGVLYQRSYAEHLAENAGECRDRERRALEHAVELLGRAESAGPHSREVVDALDFVGRLWNIFIQDLVDPENDLPNMLKAEIISIGLWIIKEAALIRCGESTNFGGLIEICAIIRDGLK
jgi:flagellar biosynthesis activator protein FlaF